MWNSVTEILKVIDDFVWGVPLMVLILSGGLLLTLRLGLLQVRRLPLALKWMFHNEEGGDGEITSFAALCVAKVCRGNYVLGRNSRPFFAVTFHIHRNGTVAAEVTTKMPPEAIL